MSISIKQDRMAIILFNVKVGGIRFIVCLQQLSKIKLMPGDIQGEKSSKDMASK